MSKKHSSKDGRSQKRPLVEWTWFTHEYANGDEAVIPPAQDLGFPLGPMLSPAEELPGPISTQAAPQKQLSTAQ